MPITFEKVSHEYSPNTPFAYKALKEIDLELAEGKITAIVGETGSGKTTIVQHLNALLLPTEGKIQVLEKVIDSAEKPKNLKALRKQVGLVFQFPEYQLFEETILKDVAFGPKNFGATEEDASEIAKGALKMVGIDASYYERSPLDLSGGQKRRVAIAGILAMDPQVLVLDEPTAGLDPQGAKQMMELFVMLNKKYHKTVLVVTHDMEHVLDYCDEVVVVEKGKIAMHVQKEQFFEDVSLMTKANINPPAIVRMRTMLQDKGFTIPNTVLSMDALVSALKKEVAR